jgi:signal transduction histidine kinase
MKVELSQKIRGGYLAAFLLLLFSFSLNIVSTRQLEDQNRWVNHTREVINKLELMLSYLKDSEIGLRGFLVMKDEKYLLPYYTSQKKVDSIYNLVKTQTADNAIQQERIEKLKDLLHRKFGIISDQLTLFKESGEEITGPIKTQAVESKKIMDSIRFQAGTMEIRENELLQERTREVGMSNQIEFAIIIISLVISLLLVAYSLITYNFENKAKKEAAQKADEYHDQLEKRIQELALANQELTELRNMEKFTSTGRIARTIAHEVRNPLTNIELAADQLDSGASTEEEKRILREMISRNSKRINYLITDLLNATKFSELNYEKTDINELLDKTLDLAQDRALLKKINIDKKYEKNIPPLLVDREKIQIALLNIIVNAIEAMPEEIGVLSIQTNRGSQYCLITISDNGDGIDEETLPKIFDPYFTSKPQGNGLGLTHSQNIILNHKGKILAFSEPGRGTAFTITLNILETG